jgi:hypothetical protein
MSLANIEGRLSLEEMENVMAGSMGRNCLLMGAGVVILDGVAVVPTGDLAMVLAGGAIGGFFVTTQSNCF